MRRPEGIDDVAARTRDILAGFAGVEGALLPVLHAVQGAFGHVPDAALPVIAEALNITRAEVHGVVTFYHDFRREPAGRRVIRLCRAEACQAMGGVAVSERLMAALGLGWGETSPDGAITLEPVYCLGLCASAPAAMIDGEVIGRLDVAAADDIVREVRR